MKKFLFLFLILFACSQVYGQNSSERIVDANETNLNMKNKDNKFTEYDSDGKLLRLFVMPEKENLTTSTVQPVEKATSESKGDSPILTLDAVENKIKSVLRSRVKIIK